MRHPAAFYSKAIIHQYIGVIVWAIDVAATVVYLNDDGQKKRKQFI